MESRSPFETLGLPRRFDLTQDQIESAYRELQRALHPDKHVGASPTERRLALSKAIEVNEAYRVLRDDLLRAEALLRASGYEPKKEGAGGDPAFLMEVMELREGLSEARAGRDRARVGALASEVRVQREAALTALGDALAQGQATLAGEKLGRLRYYARFLDEVEAIEEEWS